MAPDPLRPGGAPCGYVTRFVPDTEASVLLAPPTLPWGVRYLGPHYRQADLQRAFSSFWKKKDPVCNQPEVKGDKHFLFVATPSRFKSKLFINQKH